MKPSKRVETRDAQKQSRKTSKKVQKLACPLFLAPSAQSNCFYIVFGAMRTIVAKKAKFVTLTKNPSQKKTKKRHICALVTGPENTIFIVVSCVPKTRVLLSSHEMPNLGFF